MNILFLDDDEDFRGAITTALSNLGHVVTPAANDEQALAATTQLIDLVISDYDLGQMATRTGVEVCADIRDVLPGATFVLLSGLKRGHPAWMTAFSKQDTLELFAFVKDLTSCTSGPKLHVPPM